MILVLVWGLIRRFPVTATSIVCGLVASISGTWLRRRQISPAPEIPGSADLIPGSADLIPGSADLIPGYLPTRIHRQALVFSRPFRLESRLAGPNSQKFPVFSGSTGIWPIAVGPLIDIKAVKKAEAHIADAVKKGAKVVTGGKRAAAH
jgi:hypothetical protein